MLTALNLRAFICDLLEIAKARAGRFAGFRERHTPPDVFLCQQIEMEAQLFVYFAPRLFGV